MATLENEHDYITENYLPLIKMSAYARNGRVWNMIPEEVLSELYITLHDALPRFKGLNGARQKHFAKVVMVNKITDLRRKTGAKKRTMQSTYTDVGWTPQAERLYADD